MWVIYKKSHQRCVSLLSPLGPSVTQIRLEIISLTVLLQKSCLLKYVISLFPASFFQFHFSLPLSCLTSILGVHNQTPKFPICYQSSPPAQNSDSYEYSDGSKTDSLWNTANFECLLNTPLACHFFPLQSHLLRFHLYVALPRM